MTGVGLSRLSKIAHPPRAEPVGTCPPVLGLEVMLSEISEALVSDQYRTDWSGRGFVLLKASSKCKRESVPWAGWIHRSARLQLHRAMNPRCGCSPRGG